MFEAKPHEYLVPFDQSFRLSAARTEPPADIPDKKELGKKLEKLNDELYELQHTLYAHNRFSLLLVFQAMDAAGKDGTIRAVLRGVNPAGCQVYSFKRPSAEELDHDFLWRSATRLPERGRIGVFNRSYYEEVLIVKVHPGYLDNQNLPQPLDLDELWQQRYQSIRDHELHLAHSGTVVLKFWLNISRDEQKRRFIDRLDSPEKHWKFAAADVDERLHWPQYMSAYEDALNATSRSHAPWYAIPADNKPWMRYSIARIIAQTLKAMPISFPPVDSNEIARFDELRAILQQQ